MRILDDRPELWPFVMVSLILHALLLLLLPQVINTARFEEKPIEVFTVPEVPKQGGNWRIADIPEPKVQQKPTAAKFLGMYDSTANEEMVGTTRPGKQGSGSKGGAKARPQREQQVKQSDKGKGKLFAFNKDLFKEAKPGVERGDEGDEASGSLDDFYPDFRRGSHTYLNVLRYPGVEYFVRLKRAFKIAFNPEPPLRDYFSRNIITRGSIDVVLGVSVNQTGELAELFVFRGSGIPSYDEEALRTVRASSPFSSPPAKFLADDGLLRMTWTFSVYL